MMNPRMLAPVEASPDDLVVFSRGVVSAGAVTAPVVGVGVADPAVDVAVDVGVVVFPAGVVVGEGAPGCTTQIECSLERTESPPFSG